MKKGSLLLLTVLAATACANTKDDVQTTEWTTMQETQTETEIETTAVEEEPEMADDGEERYEYEYNEDGSWMCEKVYLGDMLYAERTYAVDADGLQTAITDITYNEDGSYAGLEFDSFGEVILEVYVDAAGNVENEMRYERTYDEEGNPTLTLTYENGVLIEEMEYITGSDVDGSWSMSGKTTAYHEDGTKTITDRDPEGSWSSEITYAADGTVIEELRYEYERNEAGEDIGSKAYRNGAIFREAHQLLNEKGEVTGIVMTEYAEDGGKTVCEYNENLECVKETVYDAAGNVLSEK